MRPFERREIAGKLGLKFSPDSNVVARQYDVALSADRPPAQVALGARQYKFNDTK